MKSKLQFALVAFSFVGLCSTLAVAEDKAEMAAPSTVTTEQSKPALVQDVDRAHEAAGAVKSHDEDVSKQASTVTDDEGMADEDMEMPEEDLDDAPVGSQAE